MTETIDEILDARIQSRVAEAVAAALSGVLKGDPGPPGPPGTGAGFGGRLALSPGLTVADQIAKQVFYYAPCSGDSVPLVIGGALEPRAFLSDPTDQTGLTLDLAGSAAWPAGTLHDVFAIPDGAGLRLVTRQWDAAMFPTEQLITGGSAITTGTGPTAWQRAGAAFDGNANQPHSAAAYIFPSNSGMANFLGQSWASPEAVSRVEIVAANNNYLFGAGSAAQLVKVWGSNDLSNWNMLGYFYADCGTVGNTNSFPINVSNRTPYLHHRVGIDGNPAYSLNVAELPFFREVAPATRRLTRFAGLHVTDAAMTARLGPAETVEIAAYEATYLGTVQIDPDAPGRITTHAEYGPSRRFGVWNAHNRRRITLRAGIITPNVSAYTVTQDRWGVCQGSGFSLDVLCGLAEEQPSASFHRGGFLDCLSAVKAYEIGIGVDTTAGYSGKWAGVNLDQVGQQMGFDLTARLTLPAFAGVRKLYGLERASTAGGVANGFVDQRSTVLEASWSG